MKLALLLVTVSSITLVAHAEEPQAPSKINMQLVKALLIRDLEELRKIENPREAIFETAWVFPRIDIPKNAKHIMWHLLTQNHTAGQMSLADLKTIYMLLSDISDYDLSTLNVSDFGIMKFLGGLHVFTKIQTTILLNAIRLKLGPQFALESSVNINTLSGLICGYNIDELASITSTEFRKISPDVFNNLHTCTTDQFQVLLAKAMKTTGYGPPQSWRDIEVRKLGMLVAALSLDQLTEIRPNAMGGVSDAAMQKMDIKMLQNMYKSQAKMLSVTAKKIYLDRVGLIIYSRGDEMNRSGGLMVLVAIVMSAVVKVYG